jgi:hypothetical protein
MGKQAPQHPGYEELKDSPWIEQGRDIAQHGGEGILDNYNRVNVFDERQRTSMEKLNEDAYRRAFDELNRGYREGMNKYASANYNRFGSLNATPSSYIADEFNRQYSRDMSNLAYNKAINYENLVNQELARRYNTLNMYQGLYNMGQIPYQQDVQNWQIRNKNRDVAYQNALAGKNMSIGNTASSLGTLFQLGGGLQNGGFWNNIFGGGGKSSLPSDVLTSGYSETLSNLGNYSLPTMDYTSGVSPDFLGKLGIGSIGGSVG